MTDKTSNVHIAASRIIGFWTVIDGDYPLTDEYRADGTIVQHIGDIVSKPHPFRIEGDFIISSIKQPSGKIFEQRAQFVLSSDTLTFLDSPKSKRIFRRSRAPNS
jgi:hypothetical protein